MLSKDVILTLIARFFTVLSGFLTSVITARYLGPAGRGNYFFVITLAAILLQFSNLGLQSSNTYFVAQNKAIFRSLVANSFWVSIFIGFLTSLITFIGLVTFAKNTQETFTFLWCILILTPTTLFFLLSVNLLVGLKKMKVYNLCQLGGNLFMIVLTITAALLHFKLRGFLCTTAIGWLIVSMTMLVVLQQYTLDKSLKFDYKIFVGTLRYALKAYITCLFGFLVLKSNIFLLKHYSGSAELGYFSIASQINDALAILPSTVALILFPDLIQNSTDRWGMTKKNTKMMAVIMLGCCIIIAVLAKPFIIFFFGKAFAPTVPILLALLPGAFFLGVLAILSQYLSAVGFPYKMILLWFFALLSVIFTSWLFIPILAGVGAALALSLTYFILFLLIFWLTLEIKKTSEQSLVIQQT